MFCKKASKNVYELICKSNDKINIQPCINFLQDYVANMDGGIRFIEDCAKDQLVVIKHSYQGG